VNDFVAAAAARSRLRLSFRERRAADAALVQFAELREPLLDEPALDLVVVALPVGASGGDAASAAAAGSIAIATVEAHRRGLAGRSPEARTPP
jgi:hypothetical protein